MIMDKQTFFDTFAQLAIEQQQKYGIPASVTLAQLALESGWGSGRAVKEANNAFCVKGTYNGQYILISDNAPNEKFRKYETIEQSFEDHSRLLMKDRYRQAPGTDYKTWTAGIQKGGYAYPPSGYADRLNKIIEQNGLTKYDAMGLSPAKRVDYKVTQPWVQGNFSMPIESGVSMVMTSDFGTRVHPFTGKTHTHGGIDIGIPSGTSLLSTEDNGRVTRTNWNTGINGNCVEVAYNRGGDTYLVKYLHMSRVDVSPGQTVSASDVIGLSGQTGRSTGPHLDFRVSKNGEEIDPKQYLAEISVYGGINDTLVSRKGEDLLADLKHGVVIPVGQGMPMSSGLSGFDIATLSNQSLIWGNAQGQPMTVGDINVSSQDGKYYMVADINGQQSQKEITKGVYDKFLSSSNVEKMFIFDKTYDEVAMISASGQGAGGPENPYASLVAMVNGEGGQDFMSWFLNKNGDGAGLGSGGDILGDMFGMLVGGLMSLETLMNVDEDTQVANLREMISARMSPEDQAKVEQLKREGVDPERAKMLVQTNAEAGLTASESQQQQQQITMRG